MAVVPAEGQPCQPSIYQNKQLGADSGSVCFTSQQLTGEIHKLETGPILQESLVDYSILLPKQKNLLRGPTISRTFFILLPGKYLEKQASFRVSKQAAELLAIGWNKGTNTAYQSGWRHWHSWYHSWKIYLLSEVFKDGLEYHSINVIRSAVYTTHAPLNVDVEVK